MNCDALAREPIAGPRGSCRWRPAPRSGKGGETLDNSGSGEDVRAISDSREVLGPRE